MHSSTGVNQFKFRVLSLNLRFNLFPVDLEFLTFFDFSLVINDNRVRKISFCKNNLAGHFIVIIDTLVLLLTTLIISLVITLSLLLFLRECFVSSAPNLKFVFRHFNFCRPHACCGNVRGCNFKLLNFVAVKEVSDVNPALLIGLDLFAEELVTGEVTVGHVKLDLLLDDSHVVG